MEILHHQKVYEGIELKDTIVHLSLDTRNSEIDNIIYYLICAQDKLNKSEIPAYENRLDSAQYKLNKFIKDMENKDISEEDCKKEAERLIKFINENCDIFINYSFIPNKTELDVTMFISYPEFNDILMESDDKFREEAYQRALNKEDEINKLIEDNKASLNLKYISRIAFL